MTIEERLEALEARIALLEGSPETVTKPKKAASLREFINSLNPQTANDTAAVIGYYQETVLGQGYFTNETLKAGFKEAKIIPPKNLSDVIAKNTKKGYIMPFDNAEVQKAWVLTNTGEKFIAKLREVNG